MHYDHLTLEQRSELERVMRARLAQAGVSAALSGGDIAFARLAADPSLTRCAKCAD